MLSWHAQTHMAARALHWKQVSGQGAVMQCGVRGRYQERVSRRSGTDKRHGRSSEGGKGNGEAALALTRAGKHMNG